jgi:holin-like protein
MQTRGYEPIAPDFKPMESRAVVMLPAKAAASIPAWRRLLAGLAGLAVIIACLEAGIATQRMLGMPIPGSVLGMGLLLVFLWTGAVPEGLLSWASGWLLLLLPALFVPIYVVPLADPHFWARCSEVFLPTAIVGAAITLSVVGWLARRMVRR